MSSFNILTNYAPGMEFGGIQFWLVCLSVWHNKFNFGHNFWTVKDLETSYLACILYNGTLSSDIQVNGLATLTMAIGLNSILDFVAARGISVSQTLHIIIIKPLEWYLWASSFWPLWKNSGSIPRNACVACET